MRRIGRITGSAISKIPEIRRNRSIRIIRPRTAKRNGCTFCPCVRTISICNRRLIWSRIPQFIINSPELCPIRVIRQFPYHNPGSPHIFYQLTFLSMNTRVIITIVKRNTQYSFVKRSAFISPEIQTIHSI